ncbi:MAG: hypothetical protein GF398_15000 [Chitinivibrionales bacterium]|nr:hypothetical protein [Chitinivibrionales bacterium]
MDTQCKGITKSGEPCKITTNLDNGYCRYHKSQAGNAVEASEPAREPAPVERKPVTNTRPDAPPANEPDAFEGEDKKNGVVPVSVFIMSIAALILVVWLMRRKS